MTRFLSYMVLFSVLLTAGCQQETIGYNNYMKGAGYLREEKLEAAIMELEKAIEAGFREAYVENDLGAAYLRMGQDNKARSHLKTAAKKDPDFSIPLYNLGLYYWKKGEKEKARSALQEAIKRGVAAKEYLLLLSRIEVQLGNPEKAEQVLREAAKKYPGNALVLHDLGVACCLSGNVGEGEQFLRKAASKSETTQIAFFNLGLLYQQGIARNIPAPSASSEAFLNAVQDNPGSPQALYELGKTYLLLSAKADPKRKKEIAKAFTVLGTIEQKNGNLNTAMKAFEAALKLDSQNISALKNLGMLHGHLGNLDKARSLFEEILAIKPNLIEVKELLSAIGTGDREKK